MKISEILHTLIEESKIKEGVVLKNNEELLAYAIVVAEAYDSAPTLDESAIKHWKALRDHNVNVLFKRIAGTGITIEYSENDPYRNFDDDKDMLRAMLYDIAFNNRLIIFTGFSDHPVFTERENHIFRTVHDYITHGTLIKTFKRNFLKAYPEFHNQDKFPTPKMLKEILPNVSLSAGGNRGLGFTLRGEMNSASLHIRLAPNAAAPAIFLEVVGQVCYQQIVGKFPDQKVAVLNDFDYQNIGKIKTNTVSKKRYEEVLNYIKSGKDEIELTISSKPVLSGIQSFLKKQIT
jgi:hypothetical protein